MNDLLAQLVAGLADGLDDHVERLGVALQVGAKPPSSPTLVDSFFDCSTFFRLWKTSQPQRMASVKALEAQAA